MPVQSSRTPRTPFTKRDYLAAWKKSGGKCGLCGEDVLPDDASIDHIVPLARGGLHALANWQLAHLNCNIAARDKRGDYGPVWPRPGKAVPMRRKRGSGSLSQRGSGRWAGSIYTDDGRRLYVYGATREEAAAKLEELKGRVPLERATGTCGRVGHLYRYARTISDLNEFGHRVRFDVLYCERCADRRELEQP